MRVLGSKTLVALLAVAMVTACSRNSDPRLLNIASSTQGPDEFAIVPYKPLEPPEDFGTLPPPAPGRANRVDANPNDDVIVALGGNPGVVARGVAPSDAGLINHSSRYGRSGNIRQQLAKEDLDFRRRKDGRLLERLFNVNVYYRAYRGQSLDQYSELERFRRLGVRTPAALPDFDENLE